MARLIQLALAAAGGFALGRLVGRGRVGGWTIHADVRPRRMRVAPPLLPGAETTTAIDCEAIQAVPASPLRRVIGIGGRVVHGDIDIECLALEIRDAGARATFAIRYPPEPLPKHEARGLGPVHAYRVQHNFRHLQTTLDVRDDLDTRYAVGPPGGSGTTGLRHTEFGIVPAPPTSARRLTLTIPRVAWRDWASEGLEVLDPIDGPWTFEVDLRGDTRQ